MSLSSNILIICITILSFFNSSTIGGKVKGLTESLLSQYSPSNRKCDENAILPEPPCCGISKTHLGRIYGGKIVELGEFPWVVMISPSGDNNNFGTGSLINSRWVLTAGHNFNDDAFGTLEVRLGEWNMKTGLNCVKNVCAPPVKKYKVDKRIVHEQYDEQKYNVPLHDIALLRLAETVTFTDYIKPICLPLGAPEEYDFANKMVVIAGWGLTESKLPSDVMLKASVEVWDSSSCQQQAINASIQICAGGVEGIDSCTGDSGGPLMLPLENDVYYQIGIVSYGGRCGTAGNPGIYVNLLSYIQWIKDTIMNNQ